MVRGGRTARGVVLAIAAPRVPRLAAGVVVGAALLLLSACSSSTAERGSASGAGGGTETRRSSGLYKVGKPYQIKGVWYYPRIDYDYVEEGVASWYGPGFHGKATANGETYDMNDLTAAHRTLPLPTIVRVTNLDNGRSLKLRVNDRGPFAQNRIIDVSRRGAQLLGFHGAGTTHVRVEIDAEESRQLAIALTGTDYPNGAMMASRQPAQPIQPDIQPVPVIAASAIEPTPAVVPIETPPPVEAPVEIAAAAPAEIGQVPPAYELQPAWSPPPAEYQPVEYQPAGDQPAIAASEPVYDASGAAPAAPVWAASAPGEALSPRAAEPAYPRAVRPAANGSATSHAYVQAGAFANPDNADRARQRLARLGPVAVVNRGAGSQPLYRVRVGPLASATEAQRMLTAVVEAGFPGSQVVVE